MSVDMTFYETPLAEPRKRGLAALLQAINTRVPAHDFQRWVEQMDALHRGDWGKTRPDPAGLARTIGGTLGLRAGTGEPVDDWTRAVAILTGLSVLVGAGQTCRELPAFLTRGDDNLYRQLGETLGRLYVTEANTAPAGPLGFFWLARAALAFDSSLRPHLTLEVKNYLGELSEFLNGANDLFRVSPPSLADRVLKFLRERRQLRREDAPAITTPTTRTWWEWLASWFNGRSDRWTVAGVLRAGAFAFLVVMGLFAALWGWHESTVINAFVGQCVTPYVKTIHQ